MMNEIAPQSEKPKSIQVLGTILAVVCGMGTLTNGLGAVPMLIVGMGDQPQPEEGDLFSQVLPWLPFLFLFVAVVMALTAIGGIYLAKYKRWANRLVTVCLLVLNLAVLGVAWLFAQTFLEQSEARILVVIPVLIGLVGTGLLGALIWFLNKKSTLQHFS